MENKDVEKILSKQTGVNIFGDSTGNVILELNEYETIKNYIQLLEHLLDEYRQQLQAKDKALERACAMEVKDEN